MTPRQEAIAAGRKTYRPSKPCRFGHDSLFRVSNGCVRCAAVRMAHKRKTDPTRREKDRAWVLANPESRRETYRRHREANRQKRLAQTAAWREANREWTREYSRKWAKDHPEQARLNAKNRRVRILGAEGSCTVDDIARITKAQGGKCACCRKRRKLTIDHIVPITKGGSNWPNNIQMLCKPCNSAKRDRDPIEHRRSIGMLI